VKTRPDVAISKMAKLHTHKTLLKSLAAITALMLLLALAACSRAEPAPVPGTPLITASETVSLSRVATAGLRSFSFELTHDSGHTTLSGAIELTRASGLVATNGLDLEAEANIGRAFVRVEAVVIGEQTWMTNPLTGVWSEIAPEDSPFAFLDPVKLVADILGDTQQATYLADSSSNGNVMIEGQIPAESLAALVGTVDPNALPTVLLTVDATSHLLKKIVLSGIVQPEDEIDTIRVITFLEFNKQTLLEPPI